MNAYTFDNSAPLAVEQLGYLEQCLDPVTIWRLGYFGPIAPGARCWEVGAGGGSVAQILAADVGETGHVVASDIDTTRLSHLAKLGNVTVVEHDITTLTAPDPGPFDFIHARLVLLHLRQRREILRMLASHLAPGGILLLEEFECTAPPLIHHTTGDEDGALFGKIVGGILDVLQTNGADLGWALHVHSEMRAAGLVDVHTITTSESWEGGSPGALLHSTNARQLAAQLRQRGIADDELDRFHALMAGPDLVAASYPLVSTRGQRPASADPADGQT